MSPSLFFGLSLPLVMMMMMMMISLLCPGLECVGSYDFMHQHSAINSHWDQPRYLKERALRCFWNRLLSVIPRTHPTSCWMGSWQYLSPPLHCTMFCHFPLCCCHMCMLSICIDYLFHSRYSVFAVRHVWWNHPLSATLYAAVLYRLLIWFVRRAVGVICRTIYTVA